jgi:aspartyl-tRNA(Asn)/glutamyl-tRNA(Gln) amidotransferase subunit A
MSIPVAPAGALPVGQQLIGDYFQEGRLLNVAHRLQQATDWHLAAPSGIE